MPASSFIYKTLSPSFSLTSCCSVFPLQCPSQADLVEQFNLLTADHDITLPDDNETLCQIGLPPVVDNVNIASEYTTFLPLLLLLSALCAQKHIPPHQASVKSTFLLSLFLSPSFLTTSSSILFCVISSLTVSAY